MGVVASAHGVQGQVKIKIFATSPTSFMTHKKFSDKSGKQLFLFKNFSVFKENIIIGTLEEVTTRNQAENLKGTELYISRDQLPSIKDEEYYYEDLIGLEVRDNSGEQIGVVKAVYNFGSGDLIEIKLSDSRETVVLPFTREAIPTVSISDGYLIINQIVLNQFRTTKRDEKSL